MGTNLTKTNRVVPIAFPLIRTVRGSPGAVLFLCSVQGMVGFYKKMLFSSRAFAQHGTVMSPPQFTETGPFCLCVSTNQIACFLTPGKKIVFNQLTKITVVALLEVTRFARKLKDRIFVFISNSNILHQ